MIGWNIIIGDRKPIYKDTKDNAAEVKGQHLGSLGLVAQTIISAPWKAEIRRS